MAIKTEYIAGKDLYPGNIVYLGEDGESVFPVNIKEQATAPRPVLGVVGNAYKKGDAVKVIVMGDLDQREI